MAARRRKSLGSIKVCKVVRGKLKCHTAKRRKSKLAGMPKRNSKGRFMKRR